MALFVLVPGAGGQAAYWALLVPELERRGHQATAVDIAEDIASVRRFYPGATEADLAETVKEVEALGRSIVAMAIEGRTRHDRRCVLRT